MMLPRRVLLTPSEIDEVLELCRQGELGQYDPTDRPVLVSGMILSPWIGTPRGCKLGLPVCLDQRVRLLFSPGRDPATHQKAREILRDRFGDSFDFGSLFLDPEPCAVLVSSVESLFIAGSPLVRYRVFSSGVPEVNAGSRMGARPSFAQAEVAADDWLLVALCDGLRWILTDADCSHLLGIWSGVVEFAPDSRLEVLTRGSSGLPDTALLRWTSWPNRSERSIVSAPVSPCSHMRRFAVRMVRRTPITPGLSGLSDWPIVCRLDWSAAISRISSGWKGEAGGGWKGEMLVDCSTTPGGSRIGSRAGSRIGSRVGSRIGSVRVGPMDDDRKAVLEACGQIDSMIHASVHGHVKPPASPVATGGVMG